MGGGELRPRVLFLSWPLLFLSRGGVMTVHPNARLLSRRLSSSREWGIEVRAGGGGRPRTVVRRTDTEAGPSVRETLGLIATATKPGSAGVMPPRRLYIQSPTPAPSSEQTH